MPDVEKSLAVEDEGTHVVPKVMVDTSESKDEKDVDEVGAIMVVEELSSLTSVANLGILKLEVGLACGNRGLVSCDAVVVGPPRRKGLGTVEDPITGRVVLTGASVEKLEELN